MINNNSTPPLAPHSSLAADGKNYEGVAMPKDVVGECAVSNVARAQC